MTNPLTPVVFAQICFTLILLSFGQIFLKLGIGKEKIPHQGNLLKTILNIIKVMMRPKCLLGFMFYVMGTFSWLMVLSKTPLSIAFPLFSMSYFLVVTLSATILKEKVKWNLAAIGLIFISLGVTCIGFSSPRHEGHAQLQKTGSEVSHLSAHINNGIKAK